MEVNKFWSRLFGICGILGGLTLFSGDMLFYYDPVNSNLYENMGNASDFRIISSTITALIAAWLYVLGCIHIFQAFKSTKLIVKNLVLICFVSISIAYGVVHAAFVAIATSSKLAIENNLNLNQSVSLAVEANNILRLIVYPIFGLLSFLFITQVWKKKNIIPKMDNSFFSTHTFFIRRFYL